MLAPHSLSERLLALDLRACEGAYRTLARQPAACCGLLTGYTRLTGRPELWLALTASGLLVDRHDRRQWAPALAATAAGWGANSALKRLISRSRPPVAQHAPRSDANGPSFPSGHAATGFAAAAAFAELLDPRPLYLLAAITTLARLALGEHYPSDLIAGAALGVAVGHGTRTAITRQRRSCRPRGCVPPGPGPLDRVAVGGELVAERASEPRRAGGDVRHGASSAWSGRGLSWWP